MSFPKPHFAVMWVVYGGYNVPRTLEISPNLQIRQKGQTYGMISKVAAHLAKGCHFRVNHPVSNFSGMLKASYFRNHNGNWNDNNAPKEEQ